MDIKHKQWNVQQQALRQALSDPQEHYKAVEIFSSQHAMTHAGKTFTDTSVSFEEMFGRV